MNWPIITYEPTEDSNRKTPKVTLIPRMVFERATPVFVLFHYIGFVSLYNSAISNYCYM
jgi:hypothetical protein